MLKPITHQELNDLVVDTITEFVASKQLFTAYDVTQQIRRENMSLNIQHASVRDWVTSDYYGGHMFSNGYTRQLLNITDQNVEAFVYGPLGSDLSTYKPTVVASPPTVGVTANRVVINATFTQVTTN